MRPLAEHLRATDPPWVELLVVRDRRHPLAEVPVPRDFAVLRVDGRRCRTKAALLDEFARALEFPPHFGGNWDAFEDCVNDLSWLPAAGYVLVVGDAHAVLPRDDGEYATFVLILQTAGREWATPRTAGVPRAAAPFHALLTVASRDRARRDWLVPVRDAPA